MSPLEWTYVVLGIAAGVAVLWLCAVTAWRLLRGPRP
jgi:hypothetical protein